MHVDVAQVARVMATEGAEHVGATATCCSTAIAPMATQFGANTHFAAHNVCVRAQLNVRRMCCGDLLPPEHKQISPRGKLGAMASTSRVRFG